MWEIVIYTLGGFALIFVDLLLIPGAVLAIVGCGFILYSVHLTFVNFGWLPALIHLAAALATAPKIVMWGLGRVALKGEMRNEDGYTGVPDRSAYLGLKGLTLSPLRPSGTVAVEFEGELIHLDCIAESGYVDADQEVIVLAERGPALLVRESSTKETV